MDITPLIPKGRNIITGYGAGGFKINDESISGSIIVFPSKTVSCDGLLIFDETALQPVFDVSDEVEMLLIGSGTRTQPLAPLLRQSLRARGINVEVMDTGAACRTYNVLASEERKVAAARLIISF
jgi:uncharacterized protein